jgi:ribosomal protein S18 acetylase RimI-like enzyme
VSWTTRRLSADDALIYRDIRLTALQTEPTSFGSDYAREVGKSGPEWASQLERNFSFGVFDGADLVGIATFIPEGMEKVRHRAHLVAVYVKPDARGKGASRALFDRLIESARREVLQLHLVVTTHNERARRFYENFGFQIYGTDPRGLKVDGRYYDDYLMVLRLDEGGKESDEK